MIWFGISTILGNLMPNTVYTYVLNTYAWFGSVQFYRISTFLGY